MAIADKIIYFSLTPEELSILINGQGPELSERKARKIVSQGVIGLYKGYLIKLIIPKGELLNLRDQLWKIDKLSEK